MGTTVAKYTMKLNILAVVVFYKAVLQMNHLKLKVVVLALAMTITVGVLMEIVFVLGETQPVKRMGCLADLDEKKIEFFLNGESMGEAFADVKVSGKMRIAVTAQGQKLRVNLGNDLKYSPLKKESNTA